MPFFNSLAQPWQRGSLFHFVPLISTILKWEQSEEKQERREQRNEGKKPKKGRRGKREPWEKSVRYLKWYRKRNKNKKTDVVRGANQNLKLRWNIRKRLITLIKTNRLTSSNDYLCIVFNCYFSWFLMGACPDGSFMRCSSEQSCYLLDICESHLAMLITRQSKKINNTHGFTMTHEPDNIITIAK